MSVDQPTIAAVSSQSTLDAVPAGSGGCVLAVTGSVVTRRRLLEMGLCTGTEVAVVRRAPFGDPIELHLRGYHLSLRAEEARCVAVARRPN
ncbi:MAG: FeoA family protein, partial [Planctomycetota bacterium]